MRDLAYWKARLVDCDIARKGNEMAYLETDEEICKDMAKAIVKIGIIEGKVLCRKET